MGCRRRDYYSDCERHEAFLRPASLRAGRWRAPRSKTRGAAKRIVRGARMRIAIFLPNWIGDVVMATPAVRALRNAYPDARIVGVLKSYVRSVVDGAPWFDDL